MQSNLTVDVARIASKCFGRMWTSAVPMSAGRGPRISCRKSKYGMWSSRRLQRKYKRGYLTHRMAWILTHPNKDGSFPFDLDEKIIVRHVVCDNPPCCNPKHLTSGSQKDNIHDAVRKGRMASGDNPLDE